MASAAAATRTPLDTKNRSLELAQAQGQTSCSHAARTTGWTVDEATGELVSLSLAIRSAHGSDTAYTVGYHSGDDDAQCSCRAARMGRGCWHRGLAIIKGRSVARLYSLAGRAEAERAHCADLAAEANAAVMASWL